MKKYFLTAAFTLFLAIFAALGAVVFEFYLRLPKADAEKISFAIKPDSGLQAISEDLHENRLIASSFIFEIYVRIVRADRKFQVGDHQIVPGMNMRSIVKILTAPRFRQEASITILEGWTLRDIKKYLEGRGIGNMEEFEYLAGASAVFGARTKDWSAEFGFLKEKSADAGLEGFLFPDTYRVFAGAGAEDIIRKMLQNFDNKFDADMRARAKNRDLSIFEAVTLASVIEREVQSEEDMRKAADIFLRRLRLGMPLQADSTVNYVTDKSTPAISYADMELKSPWNTYKYAGLPRGPIGNPGLSALRAVLEPESNSYLYFLTDKEGRVIYSNTLEEHNMAKDKYLK